MKKKNSLKKKLINYNNNSQIKVEKDNINNSKTEDIEEETLFKKMNKYYYNTEKEKIMKYSLNIVNKSIKTKKI